jgi:hypothetical protein
VGVVAPEVRKELRIFVEPQELADDLYGDDLGVKERWGGSALSEAPEILESVVDEAEDGYDEGGAKIHKKTSATSGAIGLTPSVGRSSVLLKSSKKLAHRVS